MARQPRLANLEPSTFFADGGSARPLPPGVVARAPVNDAHTPRLDELLPAAPAAVDARLLQRGRERFDIWCSPCHDRTGSGRGAVVERGYPQPPAFTDPRLIAAPDAHFYRVIARGLGKMPPYGALVPPSDRRAILAWIRVLQRSQHARLEDAPAAERDRLRREREDRPR